MTEDHKKSQPIGLRVLAELAVFGCGMTAGAFGFWQSGIAAKYQNDVLKEQLEHAQSQLAIQSAKASQEEDARESCRSNLDSIRPAAESFAAIQKNFGECQNKLANAQRSESIARTISELWKAKQDVDSLLASDQSGSWMDGADSPEIHARKMEALKAQGEQLHEELLRAIAAYPNAGLQGQTDIP